MGDSGFEPDLRRGGFRRAHSHVGKDGRPMAGKTQYTVIVADDEDELREAVCMMTPWQDFGFCLVGSASGLDYRLMVLPDHPTPIRLRTHTAESVPYLIYDSTNVQKNDWSYNEAEAILSGNYFSEGPLLMDHFLGLKQPSYRL